MIHVANFERFAFDSLRFVLVLSWVMTQQITLFEQSTKTRRVWTKGFSSVPGLYGIILKNGLWWESVADFCVFFFGVSFQRCGFKAWGPSMSMAGKVWCSSSTKPMPFCAVAVLGLVPWVRTRATCPGGSNSGLCGLKMNKSTTTSSRPPPPAATTRTTATTTRK